MTKRFRHADGALVRAAMRELAGGVAIVACGAGERRMGCTISSMASLSLEPPTLMLSLNRNSATLAAIRAEATFTINLLADRHQLLAIRFSGHGGVQGPRRFEGGEWTTLTTGAPALADALAAFDCRLEETIERHTHAIVLGGVIDLASGAGGPALGYWRGGYMPLTAR